MAVLRSFLCSLLLVAAVGAVEETIHLNLDFDNSQNPTIFDLDEEQNWITQHFLGDEVQPGIRTGRDHEKDIEVFRIDGHRACYARPIPSNTQDVREYRTLLDWEKEHSANLTHPKLHFEDFMECTNKLVPHKRLGNVEYLCRGLPVYWLRQAAPSTNTTLDHQSWQRVKRATKSYRGTGVRSRCCCCCCCCSCCCCCCCSCGSHHRSTGSYRRSRYRGKRDLANLQVCVRTVWIQGCLPGGAESSKEEDFNPKEITSQKEAKVKQ